MKLILCTLALCLSFLASVFAIKQVVREEGRKTRAALSKAADASVSDTSRNETILSRMDSLNTQLASLNGHLSVLENAARTRSDTDSYVRALQTESERVRSDLNAMSKEVARLQGIPAHLAQLTTFLDQSFDHLEKTVASFSAAEKMAPAIDELAQQVSNIDSYFSPLYLFLGLSYDPANQDLLTAYPSFDERINELTRQTIQIRQEMADLNEWLRPPRRTESTRSP